MFGQDGLRVLLNRLSILCVAWGLLAGCSNHGIVPPLPNSGPDSGLPECTPGDVACSCALVDDAGPPDGGTGPRVSTLVSLGGDLGLQDMTIEGGDLVVAAGIALERIDADGGLQDLADCCDPAAHVPWTILSGVSEDDAGAVYFSNWDLDGAQILVYRPDGGISAFSGAGPLGLVDGPPGSALFAAPHGIRWAPSFTWLFVSDLSAIRAIDRAGTAATLAGGYERGFADGPGSSARFSLPWGLAIGPDAGVFVSDYDNNRIRRIDWTGNVTTLAGNGKSGFADGTGGPNGTAEFAGPAGLAFDGNGNLLVADSNNQRIRLVGPDGTTTTFAGNGLPCDIDGPVSTASFRLPQAIAVAPWGDVYVGGISGAIRVIHVDGGSAP